MPRNVEIKVRAADLAAVREATLRMGARCHAVEVQTDRYYTVDGAHRVKLRTIAGGRAELVDYRRAETTSVRASDYTVTPVRDETAELCLVPKGQPRVVVRKRREILLWDNVRVHLDDVEGLGTFVELEAVLDERHDEATCRAQIGTLMRALALRDDELIRASYAEMVDQRTSGASTGVTKA
jgi:predicted adenylyl cyclase CyaB